MTIDRAALPFVALAALPAIAAALTGWLWIALILLVLPVAVALFFRDPERQSPADRALVLSPADGRVMHAGPARPLEAPPGDWLQVTIFLSVFDVHINRTPVAGRVERVEYVPGTFRAAFRHDSHENERSEIWIDHDGVPVVVRQVVGLLARRVVCRVAPGQQLAAGERIGLMKFGSRMDVFVPPDAVLLVEKGARVRAGETPIARLAAAGSGIDR
ncbi:MAG: phosphatidylserine decarboxylase [Acidobacteriota bacterium]|nr:MAG: phosphatidylserine decarboxylase family protein [Acidobacteriota bacterium]